MRRGADSEAHWRSRLDDIRAEQDAKGVSDPTASDDDVSRVHQATITDGISRDFACLGDGRYRLRLAEVGVEFEVDRLRRERHALVGELTVRCDLAGARTVDGVLSVGDFNLSSIRALEDRGRYLNRRAKTKAEEIDWTGLLEEFVQRVVPADREGHPAISLRELPDRPNTTTATAAGFPILTAHPQMIFGPGGALKSLLALNVAGELTKLGHRVLLIDWELSAYDHRDRLHRLFGADVPDIRYVRAERAVTHEVDRLRKIIRDDRIDFAIFDSAGFGCYGPPEAAEAALTYFRAVRQLGEIGTLHIAHQTKSDEGDKAPFGSIFWFNSARSIWYVKPAEVTEPNVTMVGAFHRKANLGPLHSSLGFQARFSDDRISIESVNVADVGDLAAKLPLRERMKYLLRSGAMTPAALADELDVKEETVKRTLRRHKKLFALVKGKDGLTRLGLKLTEGRK